MTRKILNECARISSSVLPGFSRDGSFLLSPECFSYKCLVASTVNRTPDQSAMAFLKNDPHCLCSSLKPYRRNNPPGPQATNNDRPCRFKNLLLDLDRRFFIPD